MRSSFDKVIDLGELHYADALKKQLESHEMVERGTLDSALIFVEHPAVLTLGKSANLDHILKGENEDIEIIKTDRGGEVTAHIPGQLVAYPIVPIQRWKLTPKRYVQLLEESVIHLLAEMGVSANRDKINPGVWVQGKKICAIGIRIKNRVTMHGMALNYDCDLSIFNKINPCGIADRGVTRISDHTSEIMDKELVKKLWVKKINSVFSSES